MQNWFASWTPETFVGFVTAVSAGLAAWWFRGRARSTTTPVMDKEMMSSVRLHPLDLQILESVNRECHELRLEMKDLIDRLERLSRDTAVLLDRKK
jgi:hypothetical protein